MQEQQKKIVLSGNVSECVHFFFHHTNSPVYMHFFLSIFFEKYISSLFTPPYTDTMCSAPTCGGELFFVMCIRRTKKSSFHSQKKRAIFFLCPAQVPSFGSLISFSPTTQLYNEECFKGGSEIDSLSTFVVALQTSECFESSLCILALFYVLTFFRVLIFFVKTLL